MRKLAIASLWGLTLGAAGCLVGPRYQRPPVTAPPGFRAQTVPPETASLADLPWWEIFRDETLRQLVRTALINNYDVHLAATRVEQARQIAAQARAQQLPAVGYEAALSGGKNEILGAPSSTGGDQAARFLPALQASWELDFWGRVRRLKEAALADYLATEQARRGVLLALVGQVAQSYFELLELDNRHAIAVRTVASFEGSRRIFQERLDAGAASRLETARAEAALATVAASVPELERQIEIKENELSVLLGANPGAIGQRSNLLAQTVPPAVPAGLPSALLERRPDVLAAELAVRAANARVGVAQAAYFPQVSLTTLLGRLAAPVDEIMAGGNNVWSAAGAAIGPIYQGGSLRARKRQAIAAWEQARLAYQQTALNAFRDVANALVTREKIESTRSQQIRAVQAYNEAVAVSQQRYAYGKSSYYEVLEAQQQLFPAENALSQTELARRVVIVQLYQALGGGWNLKSPGEWSGAAPATQPHSGGESKQ